MFQFAPATSVLICMGLCLGLVEIALRLDVTNGATHLGVDRPIVLIGSSRSRFGLSPSVIEDELATLDGRREWSINLSRPSLTNVGLYQRYLDMIGPDVSWDGGVLAIELRGAGMNDGFMLRSERRFLRSSQEGAALRARPGDPWVDSEGFAASLERGDLEGAAAALFSQLRIAHLDATQLPWIRPWLRPGWGDDASFASLGATALKGWVPIMQQRTADLQESFWRRRYRGHLLDYRVGGVQARAISALIDAGRAAGLTPVLYILPITSLQRGFYAEGDYERFLEAARSLAAQEGLPLFDFDTGHEFSRDQFHDVNHLTNAASEEMSRLFARRVLAPILARQRQRRSSE